MKKIFTLTLLLCLAVCANAQRKTWDFTKGFSATTIANLEADTKNWTPSENGSKKWAESKARTKDTEAMCEVDGETWIIPETKGMIFHATSAKHLNIVYQEGNDDTHVWLNGAKGEDAITIPDVPAGEKITVVFSSHGGNADRGFKVSTSGVTDESGQTQFLSAGQATVVLINNNESATNVKLSAVTGGIHFYKIIIGEGDETKTAKVAYLYDGTEDNVLAALQARENTEVTSIDVTKTTVTAEQLQGFDVTVIGASVPADNAAVQVVKEALPWTPFLNLNAQLYPAWTYGDVVPMAPVGVVDNKNLKNPLFTGVSYPEDFEFKALILSDDIATPVSGLTLGDYFAGDNLLAVTMNEEGTAGDSSIIAIHAHNITHNGYLYMPYSPAYSEMGTAVLNNAVGVLQDSKSEITPANAPTIGRIYKDQFTKVFIKAPNQPKARVFYTTDGSEPTAESAEYTDTLILNEVCTVKAVAIAEGYTLSKAAELAVEIKSQPKTPVIVPEMGEGETTLKITCESEDADIWYNFTGAVDTLKSTKYVDSIAVVITMPQDVTAFAVAGGEVFSEVATLRALVKNPRVVIDVAAHFSAPQWTGDNNAAGLSVANGKGMFSWGASAASMYIGTGTTKTETDPETGDEIEVTVYTDEDLRPFEVVLEAGENPEWKLASRGTCLIWQNTGAQTTNFGSNDNYNPMYSTDVDPLFPVTKNDIQFYKFAPGEPGNGSIGTINKYKAPLDVVVLANMQGGPLLVQVSADSTEWVTVDTIAKTGQSRMWSKYVASYDGTDEVYVRLTQEVASSGAKVFDIYIANQGEKSQALLEDLNQELSGIRETEARTVSMPAGIYNISGIRLSQKQHGLNILVGKDGQVRKVFVK